MTGRRIRAAAVLLPLAGALGCPHAAAPALPPPTLDPVVLGDADLRWYDVRGHDVRSLRESLRAAAPLNEAGEHVNGDTRWVTTWSWKGGGEPCRVEQVSFDLSVIVSLPRWTPDPGTDPALVDQWRAYLEALGVHERGHVDLVTAEVAQLDDILRGTPCADADGVGATTLDAIRALNEDYDVRTEHGRLQGARFWSAPEWGADLDAEAGFAE